MAANSLTHVSGEQGDNACAAEYAQHEMDPAEHKRGAQRQNQDPRTQIQTDADPDTLLLLQACQQSHLMCIMGWGFLLV